jgi:hypothetical protein
VHSTQNIYQDSHIRYLNTPVSEKLSPLMEVTSASRAPTRSSCNSECGMRACIARTNEFQSQNRQTTVFHKVVESIKAWVTASEHSPVSLEGAAVASVHFSHLVSMTPRSFMVWHCLIDRCGPVATLLCLFVYLISLSVQLHIAPIFAPFLGRSVGLDRRIYAPSRCFSPRRDFAALC